MTTQTGFKARLMRFLFDRPDQWISRAEMARVGGAGGYRQRISECRALGCQIECRKRWSPKLKATLTEYRYRPVRRAKAA